MYTRIAWPWTPLGWVALVPWLAVLDRSTSWRGVIGTTLLMAVAFELAVFGWFAHAIEVYTGTPEIAALVLLMLMAPLLQPQLLALALARHVARRRGAGRARVALAEIGRAHV